MLFNYSQVSWAASECERQEVAPIMIVDMLKGLDYACKMSDADAPGAGYRFPSLMDILLLGKYVEPARNEWYFIDGSENPVNYRRTAVTFRTVTHKVCHWELVPHAMQSLCENSDLVGDDGAITLDEFITQLLYIHPFEDGNGRAASIVYNWFNHSLVDPTPLPAYNWE